MHVQNAFEIFEKTQKKDIRGETWKKTSNTDDRIFRKWF